MKTLFGERDESPDVKGLSGKICPRNIRLSTSVCHGRCDRLVLKNLDIFH